MQSFLSLQEALPPSLNENPPDLAILWFPFASPEALQTLETKVTQLRQLGKPDPLPILLIIDQYGSHWVQPGFRLGVTDILTRPIHPLVLRQRVNLILQARQTEQAEERFRTIADFTYDWEYWRDNQGGLIYNSPACERITGWQACAFVEDSDLLLRIVHPSDRDRIEAHYIDEMQVQNPGSLDFRIITENNRERWVGHVCQPVYSSDGSLIGRRVSNRDITERKQAEQTLLREERLAVMGRLLASIAHEINNPLQTMSASIELIMDFPLESQERQKYLQVLRQEIERLMKISRGVLDFARPARAEPTPTSVRALIEQALFLANKQLNTSRVQVQVILDENLPPILVSADQIGQVCLNLIINAIEHMPLGGELMITAHLDTDQVLLSFKDNGEGIPEQALDLIFEPFYTTRANGTGLGLAISLSLLKLNGGTLTVNSTPGNGATFTASLPVSTTNEIIG